MPRLFIYMKHPIIVCHDWTSRRIVTRSHRWAHFPTLWVQITQHEWKYMVEKGVKLFLFGQTSGKLQTTNLDLSRKLRVFWFPEPFRKCSAKNHLWAQTRLIFGRIVLKILPKTHRVPKFFRKGIYIGAEKLPEIILSYTVRVSAFVRKLRLCHVPEKICNTLFT